MVSGEVFFSYIVPAKRDSGRAVVSKPGYSSISEKVGAVTCCNQPRQHLMGMQIMECRE